MTMLQASKVRKAVRITTGIAMSVIGIGVMLVAFAVATSGNLSFSDGKGTIGAFLVSTGGYALSAIGSDLRVADRRRESIG